MEERIEGETARAARLIIDTLELNNISTAHGFEAACNFLLAMALQAGFTEEHLETLLEDMRIHFKMNKKA